MKLSLLAAARQVPDRTALVADGIALTYGELGGRVRQTLAWLSSQGIESRSRSLAEECRVALVGENRLDTLLALFALLELGVPVVMIHPRLTPTERQQLIRDAAPRLVIDESWCAPPWSTTTPQPEYGGVDDGGCLAILYTSGTTGRPKGAMLSRAAFLAAAEASARNLGWQEEDRWLLSLPVAHVGGLSIVIRCLAARRTVVLETARRFDAPAVLRVIETQRVTLLSTVPTTLDRLLTLDPPWQPPGFLRAILLGGAAAPTRLLQDAADRGWPVLTTYGLTEACSQVTTQRYGTQNRGEGGAGEPLPGMEVRVRDGVVEIRGPNLFSGYFPPGIHPHPFDADDWFSTGDLGRLDEHSCLHLLARRTDLIVSGGENVYPVEIEEVLEQHPAIGSACVVGVDDEAWGQVVAAVLVAAPQARPAAAELESYCAERLAPYKRPRKIVYLSELPTSQSGKVDRQAARAAVQGAPVPGLGRQHPDGLDSRKARG